MAKKIQCAVFDLDGVITETSVQHFEGWKYLAKKLGITLQPSFEEKLKGISRLESLEVILSAHGLEDKYSLEEKKKLTDIKNDYYKKLLHGFTKDNINKGVLQLLDYLKTNNIFLALGSASKNSPFILEALQIKEYFDYVVDPRGKQSKPAPDIFVDAAKHFGLDGEECIAFEDAVAGVTSINKANMYSIGIGDPEILHHANVVYKDVAHIDMNHLEKVLKGEIE